MLVTDALTCFAAFLKGYHSFSVLFAPPPSPPSPKDISRWLECFRNPFYITRVDWKAEATTTVWHIQGFFFPFLCFFFVCFNHFTTTLTRKTLNKTGTQQQSILKIALVLPGSFFFKCFSPNCTNNNYSNYCGNIVKCYLTSFSPRRSLSCVY